jgi:hypothetical protein
MLKRTILITYREYDEFAFPMTIHPDVSGRLHALLMHERLSERINKHEGVKWVTTAEMVDGFKSKNKSVKGALMPVPLGEILESHESRQSSFRIPRFIYS